MKAAEYAERFNNAENKLTAIRTIGADYLREVGTIGKQRGCKTDRSLLALLNEQDAKWRAMCRKAPDILPDGFEAMIKSEMPDLYRRWKQR